ncbi:MAG TPA: hypothetical protein VGR32_09025 [Brevundimonas sp.]|jgi:hypothetical protein|uniref:hypothetical protein n=1 Tax=Brevundimonas sp. TaxID=1871086 RepID=UPI002DECD386|nr:hypothetical protein [Brevundimonas sp.]
MRFIGIVATGAVALSACATPAPQPPVMPMAADDGCTQTQGYLVLTVSPALARQGAPLTVGAAVSPAPWSSETLPSHCLSSLEASPAAVVSIAPGRDAVTISPDAAPGTEVTLTGRYRQDTGSVRFRVVGRDEVVLTGTWRQDRVKCDPGHVPGQPLAELKFTDDGKFGATWQPFESYVDYWGSIAFDPGTGAVTLTPTGGNFVPPLLDVEGTARLDGDRRLILEGVYLGDRNERNLEPRVDPATGQFVVNPDGSLIVDRPVCTYEFVR